MIYIVHGSPRAGKSTYVQRNRDPGDVVIDLDEIIKAVSFDSSRHINNKLLKVGLDIRDHLMSEAESGRLGDGRNVWIIGCYPNKAERDDLAHRLGAELIHIDSTPEATIKRAEDDPLYDGDINYSVGVVEGYWEKYES